MRGVDGFVLFNRLFQPDIDIEKEEHHFPYHLSHEDDNRLAAALYRAAVWRDPADPICANTGIFNGKDVVKMLLAGADCVQVVSTVYKNGIGQVGKILEEIGSLDGSEEL
ncbi:MAG: hypothetical protein MZV63_46335 [Marinilabiliales bacterium]|nr:hypothetical protein [Marinilabiliales bacterium]